MAATQRDRNPRVVVTWDDPCLTWWLKRVRQAPGMRMHGT